MIIEKFSVLQLDNIHFIKGIVHSKMKKFSSCLSKHLLWLSSVRFPKKERDLLVFQFSNADYLYLSDSQMYFVEVILTIYLHMEYGSHTENNYFPDINFVLSFHFVDQQELGHVYQCIKQFQSEHHLVSWVNRYSLLFSSVEYLPLFCCMKVIAFVVLK